MYIGADGIMSKVRQAMLESNDGHPHATAQKAFECEEVVLPGQYKVMIQSTPESLEADAVHALEGGSKANFSLFCIPTVGNQTCALVAWRRQQVEVQRSDLQTGEKKGESGQNDMPVFLRDDATVEEIRNAIQVQYPLFGRVTDEAVMQLKSQKPSEVRTIRCNRYHHTAGRALLLGDSAHSTGGSLVRAQQLINFAKLFSYNFFVSLCRIGPRS